MADFYSFEYVDEPPVQYGDDLVEERGNPRKNQSLSGIDTEFLREAMRRLVPSSYVYGESGIGERAYELYGSCISFAFSGTRSRHLVASLCVMHASYERNSDLVILPEDIEEAYKPLHIHQIRVNNIQKAYTLMCQTLKVPELRVKSEKLFGRVFRDCCLLPESAVSLYSQTALRFEAEIISALPKPRTDHLIPSRSGNQRVSSRCQFRQTTIVALAAVFALRFHEFRGVTAKTVQKHLHVSNPSFHNLSRRYQDAIESKAPPIQEPPRRKDEFGIPIPLTRRVRNPKRGHIRVGNEFVPSGYIIKGKDQVDQTRGVQEEVMRIAIQDESPRESREEDHLALLYLDEPAALPPPNNFPIPSQRRPKRTVPDAPEPAHQSFPDNPELDSLFNN